jgi:hypothetical protein
MNTSGKPLSSLSCAAALLVTPAIAWADPAPSPWGAPPPSAASPGGETRTPANVKPPATATPDALRFITCRPIPGAQVYFNGACVGEPASVAAPATVSSPPGLPNYPQQLQIMFSGAIPSVLVSWVYSGAAKTLIVRDDSDDRRRCSQTTYSGAAPLWWVASSNGENGFIFGYASAATGAC